MSASNRGRGVLWSLGLGLLGAAALGCASTGTESPAVGEGPAPSFGVTQSGAQDFAQFKAIVDRGQVPAPEVLDELGFMAEHKLELPPATCGERLCVHAKLGVMRNLVSGNNCTMVFVGLNSPVRPDQLPRPALHVVLAVEGTSDRVTVQRAVRGLLLRLKPDDVVSLVPLSEPAEAAAVRATSPGDPALLAALDRLPPSPGPLYDGLRAAAGMALKVDRKQGRVIYLGAGRTHPELGEMFTRAQTEAMARAWAAAGVGFTFVGLGQQADGPSLRRLALATAGNSYVAAGAADAEAILTTEVETALFALARDFQLSFDAGPEYMVRALYGAGEGDVTRKSAVARAAALYLGHRASASDPGSNRRGGGGGLVVELVPWSGEEAPKDVGTLNASWRDGESGAGRSAQVAIQTLGPVDLAQGQFGDATASKAFVMTNVYAGLALAVRRAADGDRARAAQTLRALAGGMRGWLEKTPDPDIQADLAVVERLAANIERDGQLSDGDRPMPEQLWPRE